MKIYVRNRVPIKNSAIDLARRTVGPLMLIEAYEPNLNKLVMEPHAITEARDCYMLNSQVMGEMHETDTKDRVVACWQDGMGNLWFEAKVVDDSVWEKVTNGTYTGLSWGGYIEPVDLGDGFKKAAHAEMWECSFVDEPAVPTAVFNSEDEDEIKKKYSLCDRIMEGKVKPRVRMENRGPGLMAKVSQLLTQIQQSLNPASGGESNNDEEFPMTLEEIKQAISEAVSAAVQPLQAQLDEMKNSLAAGSEASEGADPEPEPEKAEAEKSETENSAPGLTAEDVSKAVQDAVAAATKPLQDEIEALKKQPGVSQRIQDVDDKGEAKKGPRHRTV